MKNSCKPYKNRPKVSCKLIRIHQGQSVYVEDGEEKQEGCYVVRVEQRENEALLAHLRKNCDVRTVNGYRVSDEALKRLARKTFARMAADFPFLKE